MAQFKKKPSKKAASKKIVTKKAPSKKKVVKKTTTKKKGLTKVDELKAMFEKKGVGHTIEAIAKKFNTHNKGAQMVIFLAKIATTPLVLVRKEDHKYYVK